MRNRRVLVLGLVVLLGWSGGFVFAQYDPPAGYYSSATGTGTTLKNQLNAIMTSGHIQQTYGDFRYDSDDYDEDPNNPSNILLVYNRASVSSNWDLGATWNREHVWPQSRQPGSASNSSKGNLGDPYALRPCNPVINSNRANMAFGNYDTTGSYGSQGSYYFPGDTDKGDIARSLFYSATRYQSTLTLANGDPSGDRMGDLHSLLRWHFTDPPDEFERRRNHVIYGNTHNRNAYIDHPEFAWSALGDGNNDSKLYVGGTPPGDGASALTVNLGPVILGAAVPADQAVTLYKVGANPTYYSVTADGEATSSVNGMYNAFDVNTQNRSIDVGLSTSTASAGLRTGTVTVDNIDVEGAGTGQGSYDGDDVITVNLNVLDHSEASFSAASNVDVHTIDFGEVTAGSGVQTVVFNVYNLESTVGFTAALDLDSIGDSGNTAVLYTNLAPFSDLAAGSSELATAYFDTAVTPGSYEAIYTLNVSDEDLPGAQAGTSLQLTLVGEVVAGPIFPFDDDGDGSVGLDDFVGFMNCITGPGGGLAGDSCANHDFDSGGISDGDVDLDDFAAFQLYFDE